MALPSVLTRFLTKKNKGSVRLCILRKSHEAEVFGFAVYCKRRQSAEKRHFVVCSLSANSPAERSGLRCYDRILEVDGVNVFDEPYSATVQRLKAAQKLMSLELLVAEPEAFKEYAALGLPMNAQLPGTVVVAESPCDTGCGSSCEHSRKPRGHMSPEDDARFTPHTLDRKIVAVSPSDKESPVERCVDEQRGVTLSPAADQPGAAILSPPDKKHGGAMLSPVAEQRGRATVSPVAEQHGKATVSPVAEQRGKATVSPVAEQRGKATVSPVAELRGKATVSPVAEQRGKGTVSTVAEQRGKGTVSPVAEQRGKATVSPVAEQRGKATVSPVAEQRGKATVSPVAEQRGKATVSPVAEQRGKATVSPVAEQRVEATVSPVAELRVEATVSPVAELRVKATVSPVAEQRGKATVSPVAEQRGKGTVSPVADEQESDTTSSLSFHTAEEGSDSSWTSPLPPDEQEFIATSPPSLCNTERQVVSASLPSASHVGRTL